MAASPDEPSLNGDDGGRAIGGETDGHRPPSLEVGKEPEAETEAETEPEPEEPEKASSSSENGGDGDGDGDGDYTPLHELDESISRPTPAPYDEPLVLSGDDERRDVTAPAHPLRLDNDRGRRDPAAAGLIPNGTVLAGSTGSSSLAAYHPPPRRGDSAAGMSLRAGGGVGGIRSLEAGGGPVPIVDETVPLPSSLRGGGGGGGGMLSYVADGLRDLPERVNTCLTRSVLAFRFGEIRRIDEDENNAETNRDGYDLCGFDDDPDDYVLISDLASRWNHLVRRRRIAILGLTAALLWPAGLYCLPKFTRNTDSTFHPIDGTPSAEAVDAFRAAYGGCGNASTANGTNDGGGSCGLSADDPLNPGAFVVLDQLPEIDDAEEGDTITDGTSQLYRRARSFALGFEPYLLAHPPFDLRGSGNDNGTDPKSSHTLSVTSYYSLQNEGLAHTLGRAMVSPSGTTTVVRIQYAIPSSVSDVGHLKRAYIDQILDSIESYGNEFVPKGVAAGYTGLRFFQRDMTEALHEDLRRMDLAVMPLALLILCWVLGRGTRIAVVPLAAIFTTVCGWATIMHLVSRGGRLQVTQFTPSVMMSLTVGMGIDYTLFLLSRVISETDQSSRRAEAEYALVSAGAPPRRRRARERRDRYAAIESMIRFTGHTIVISGVTLLCSFLGLTLLPLEMLRSVGVGAAVAIAVSLAVNLTAVPALLHTQAGEWALNDGKGDGDGGGDADSRRNGDDLGWSWEETKEGWSDALRRALCCLGRQRRRDSDASSYSSFVEPPEQLRRPLLSEDDRDEAYTSFNDVLQNGGGGGGGGSNGNNDLSAPFLDGDGGEIDEGGVDDDDGAGGAGGDGGRCVGRNCLLGENSGTSDEWERRTIELEHDGEEDGFVGDLLSGQRRSKARQGEADAGDAPTNAEERPSMWRRLSKHLLHPWRGAAILLAVMALVLPVALQAPRLRSSISVRLLLPRSSPSLAAYANLGDKFGPGTLSPYRIVFDGREMGKEVDTEEAFEVMHGVVGKFIEYDMAQRNETTTTHPEAAHEVSVPFGPGYNTSRIERRGRHLAAEERETQANGSTDHPFLGFPSISSHAFDQAPRNKSDVTRYAGIAVAGGVAIPHAAFVAAQICDELYGPDGRCPVEPLHALTAMDASVTSSDRMTTYVTVVLGYDPFGDDGIEWLIAARDRLNKMEREGTLGGYRVVLDGGTGIEYDAVRTVYAAAPLMIAVTLLTVFLLVGAFFRSVVAPLRSVLGVCLTLSFVYGLLVLTYQDGALGWTRVPNLRPTGGGTGEVCWIAPLMAFSVVVGLALDYDVFLSSRVLEHRLRGRTHRSSVVSGLDETAGIITAAGLIMAVAFGGLMLSASPALYQWSFLLTAAVLVDTFVVRTVVVPILLGFTGRASWWPRGLPPAATADGGDGGNAR